MRLKPFGVFCSSLTASDELDTSADRAAAGAAEVASPDSAEANGAFRLLLIATMSLHFCPGCLCCADADDFLCLQRGQST